MERSRIGEMEKAFEKGLDVARKKGAEGVKFIFRQNESISCEFENARLKSTGSRQTCDYSIEVLVKGKRGNTVGSETGDFEELIGRAVALARNGSAAHFREYPAPAKSEIVRTHSPGALSLTRERMIEAAGRIVEALKGKDPAMFIQASARRSEAEGLLVTSGGVRHAWRNTAWGLDGGIQRTRGTDMFFAGFDRGGRDLNELFDPGLIARKILLDLERGETNVEAPTGKLEVLLSPELTAMFMHPLMMGVNGRAVAKGESPLKGKLGEKLLDPRLTLVDDPHMDFDLGAAELDADGIPTRKFDIFRDGVLKGFLYDLDSAGLAGAEPTGHNGCWPHALCVSPGDKSREEIQGSIKDGLYVKGMIGFGQSNMLNGDVSGNVGLGFRIREGKIAGRVKDTMLAGNVYELLREKVELSREVDEVIHAPYMKLSGVSISAAKQ